MSLSSLQPGFKEKPKGQILLEEISSISDINNIPSSSSPSLSTKNEFEFQIVTKNQVYLIPASNAKEKSDWINLIQFHSPKLRFVALTYYSFN